jgi:hypothetical protein
MSEAVENGRRARSKAVLVAVMMAASASLAAVLPVFRAD